MKFRRNTIISTMLSGMMALFACFIMGGNANAQEISLKIAPYDFKIDLKPGEVYENKFTLYNEGSGSVQYTASVVPYNVTSDGNGNYNVSYSSKSDYTEMVDWVTFEQGEGTVESGGKVEINFKINVPQDAPGGGQYVALLASSNNGTDSSKNGTTIDQKASIGPVVYATIHGVTRETAKIGSHDINGFLFQPPISSTSMIENTGNVHGTAEFTLKVYPFLGGESVYNNEENPKTVMIMPGTTKYYVNSWDESPAIGIYKVVSEVKIFDESSTVEKMVIICPMWVLILIIVFILAVIFWLVARAKSRKQQ